MALVEVYGSQRSLAFDIINGKTNNSVCLVPWQLWTIIWNCHFYIKMHIVKLPLRVKQNSLISFFELEVAKCFYVSKSLFPGFGYGKLKCVFAIIKSNYLILHVIHEN